MTSRRARLDLGTLYEQWLARVDAEVESAVLLRHAVRAAPDVSGAEEPTARRVAEAIVAGPGSPVQVEVVAGTGRMLSIGPAGPAVAVRAELDALSFPGPPVTALAPSTRAVHACGHDVHLAAVAALARAARGLELPCGLGVLLQPREEVGPTGAQDVLDEGVLGRHQVRALVAAHVQPLVPAGCVAADAGPVNAAVDEVEIVMRGHGGHGAYPHLARDPVPALCRAVLALQDAARDAVDPLHPVVVAITQLQGAGAPNVIPGTAWAAGTVRTMREQDAVQLHRRIGETVEGIAAAHRCTGSYLVRRGEPALVNDEALARRAQEWLARLGVAIGSFASCGSDDFATYVTALPILMLFVGTGEGPAGPMLHDARYSPPDTVVREVALALLAAWLAGAQTVVTDAPAARGSPQP